MRIGSCLPKNIIFQTKGHNSRLRSFKFILNWSFMFSDFWQFMSASTYSNRKINLNKLLEPLRTIRKNELFFPQILCAFLVCSVCVLLILQRKTCSEAQSYMSLMGGVLEEFSNRMIGIDDMVSMISVW